MRFLGPKKPSNATSRFGGQKSIVNTPPQSQIVTRDKTSPKNSPIQTPSQTAT